MASGIWFLDQGNLLHRECEVLATGPPGKFLWGDVLCVCLCVLFSLCFLYDNYCLLPSDDLGFICSPFSNSFKL